MEPKSLQAENIMDGRRLGCCVTSIFSRPLQMLAEDRKSSTGSEVRTITDWVRVVFEIHIVFLVGGEGVSAHA